MNTQLEQYQKDLASRNNMILFGTKRYYQLDVSNHDIMLGLENSSPIAFVVEGHKFDTKSSWYNVLSQLVEYLLMNHFVNNGKKRDFVLNFRCSWSPKVKVFSENKEGVNWAWTIDGFYFNNNHSALHSFWMINELLSYFGVSYSDVTLLIHRSQISEPEEVTTFFRGKNRNGLRKMLMEVNGMGKDSSMKVVNTIGKMNSLLLDIGGTYTDFFLFDSLGAYLCYSEKAIQNLKKKYSGINDTLVSKCVNCLNYLKDYYFSIK